MSDAIRMRAPSLLITLCLLLTLLAVPSAAAEGEVEPMVTVHVIHPDGTEVEATFGFSNDTSAWNASMIGFDALDLEYAYSTSEWGVMVESIANASSDAAWGEIEFWYWGLYTMNPDGAWEASMVGASDLEIADGDAIAWFATSGNFGPGECTVDEMIANMTAWEIHVLPAGGEEASDTVTFDGCSDEDGWSATEAMFTAAEIDYNASASEWGVMMNSIYGSANEAQWGDLDFWYWGLFEMNETSEAWEATSVGISDYEAVNGSATLMWAPTMNGTWEDDFASVFAEAHAAQQIIEDAAAFAEMVVECETADHMVMLGADGLSYLPAYIEIDAGESVCWMWTYQSMGHNVMEVADADATMALEDGFRSGDPDGDIAWLHTFEENGTYHFVCQPHAMMGMRGVVQVGPVPASEEPVVPDSYPVDERNGVPGFGLAAGGLALLGAALAGRREE